VRQLLLALFERGFAGGGFSCLIAPAVEQYHKTVTGRGVIVNDKYGRPRSRHLLHRLQRQRHAKCRAAAVAITILINQ
jgi:hypothetical protein